MTTITLQGNVTNTNGDLPEKGSLAPDFSLVTMDLEDVSLDDYKGMKKLLNIVPSLDTDVCATSTKRFNAEASKHPGTVILIISSDLPFASKRFCSEEGLGNVVALSMMRSRKFAKDYGVLIDDGPLEGITARAVVVLDKDNKVVYTELVSEITDEPNYDAALAALGD